MRSIFWVIKPFLLLNWKFFASDISYLYVVIILLEVCPIIWQGYSPVPVKKWFFKAYIERESSNVSYRSRRQILQMPCLISYGSRVDTISSVSSVYHFLPLYIFSMQAKVSEKFSKLLNPTNSIQSSDGGKGTDLNQIMGGGKAWSLTSVTFSNIGNPQGKKPLRWMQLFHFLIQTWTEALGKRQTPGQYLSCWDTKMLTTL